MSDDAKGANSVVGALICAQSANKYDGGDRFLPKRMALSDPRFRPDSHAAVHPSGTTVISRNP